MYIVKLLAVTNTFESVVQIKVKDDQVMIFKNIVLVHNRDCRCCCCC